MMFPTLEKWSQDPKFVEIQVPSTSRYPVETASIEACILVAATHQARFSSEDIMDRVGRVSIPPNLIGAVIGSWRRRGRLRVVGREKSRHQAAKGRWVNVFQLTSEGSE